MRSLYKPPSLSLIAWRNHWNSVTAHKAKPKASEYAPQP